MKEEELEIVEETTIKKAKKRAKKKKPQMQVSGKSVFQLQELMKKQKPINPLNKPQKDERNK